MSGPVKREAPSMLTHGGEFATDSDAAHRATSMPLAGSAGNGGSHVNGYATKAELERVQERVNLVETEVVSRTASLDRKMDLVLGAIRTLTDSNTEHLAMHKSKDKIDEARQSQSNEADLEHAEKIMELEVQNAALVKRVEKHDTLLERSANLTGKGAIGVLGGGASMVVIDRLVNLFTNASFLEAILRLLKLPYASLHSCASLVCPLPRPPRGRGCPHGPVRGHVLAAECVRAGSATGLQCPRGPVRYCTGG